MHDIIEASGEHLFILLAEGRRHTGKSEHMDLNRTLWEDLKEVSLELAFQESDAINFYTKDQLQTVQQAML